MEFEWNPAKNQANLAKHKISFEDAIEVFDDPNELTEPAHVVAGETRLQTIGIASAFAVLLVVHTQRTTAQGQPVTRVISARPASRRERSRYERRQR